MRGEYLSSSTPTSGLPELPPRARRIRHPKIIGKNDRGNYLRVRGEYSHTHLIPSPSAELPPRARRIRAQRGPADLHTGTTSACAENTLTMILTIPSSRNYLRVRGEYLTTRCLKQRKMELPPRARRIQDKQNPELLITGTTSACAENTNHQNY